MKTLKKQDMNSETGAIAHEEMLTKHETDGSSDAIPATVLDRMKIEPSGLDSDKCDVDSKGAVKAKCKDDSRSNTGGGTGIVEQVFVKDEDDQGAEGMCGIALDSIKSEPNEDIWDKCHVDDKETLEMEIENNKLDMEMYTQVKEEPFIKNERDENADAVAGILSSRVKKEYDKGDNLDEGAVGGVKLEADMESEEFKVAEITEDYDIKSESEDADMPSNSMAKSIFAQKQHELVYKKAGRKSFRCYNCSYTSYTKHHLIDHLKVHNNKKYVNLARPGFEIRTCIQCHITFKSQTSLDDHIKSEHSSAIASSEIHECKTCTYKTIVKGDFDRHVSLHSGLYELSTCTHCVETFESKAALDDHSAEKHPNFSKSVATPLHECKECTYITTLKPNFDQHMLTHPKTTSSYNLRTCIHCNVTLKSKRALDDHVVRIHPNLATSLGRRIYECTECSYKTVQKSYLNRHIATHPEAGSSYKLNACINCDATFKNKISLDDHIVKKHPDFITSVTSKLYECTKCVYKTTRNDHFNRHMLVVHPETGSSSELNKCIQCNATFRSEEALDDHVFKKHQDFFRSITRKTYECTQCDYKTVLKSHFDKHVSAHSKAGPRCKPSTCIHCGATFKSKRTHDDHVVKKHPSFITSITSKLHECTKCIYKTVSKGHFVRHTLIHHGTTPNYKQLIPCIYCEASFKNKVSLDDHVVKKHPEFVTSIARQIYECANCDYKTTLKGNFDRHMSKHPETASSFEFRKCAHCNATFTSKGALDDHVVKKHPDFISSVDRKIYECTECSYKTVLKYTLYKHMLTHPETASCCELRKCAHCNAAFKSKDALDDHIVRKHPIFIPTLGRKIYECTECSYKTTSKHKFDRHRSVHPEAGSSNKLILCSHCNAIFTTNSALDDHIVEKHRKMLHQKN